MKRQIIIITVLALTVIGCNSAKKENAKAKEASQNEMIMDRPITEKYWKLITLEGQKLTMAENQEREIFFTLKTDEKRITGFAGCNTL